MGGAGGDGYNGGDGGFGGDGSEDLTVGMEVRVVAADRVTKEREVLVVGADQEGMPSLGLLGMAGG